MNANVIDPTHLPRDYHQVWKPTRASLTIESMGTVQLGNCYRKYGYRVTSFHRLDAAKLQGLFKLGFLGSGQSCKVESQHDGKELPAFEDEVPCRVVNDRTGQVVDIPALNQFTGLPLGTQKYGYYVYECWTYCDSGD